MNERRTCGICCNMSEEYEVRVNSKIVCADCIFEEDTGLCAYCEHPLCTVCGACHEDCNRATEPKEMLAHTAQTSG